MRFNQMRFHNKGCRDNLEATFYPIRIFLVCLKFKLLKMTEFADFP